MAEAHHLSSEAHGRLTAEHHDLTTRGRLEIASKIEEARALGDLSENGDYHAAKEEQGKMEARIRQLEAILERAVIVEASDADGTVGHGSIVELRYEGDDATERMLFGSIEERVEGFDVVSPGSPLGQALAGRQAGDTVSYEAPGGTLAVEIVSISR
jgi:transcription elongation factor GreA